jgi:hypothetical protein
MRAFFTAASNLSARTGCGTSRSTIDPGVIGRLLHDGIAGLQMDHGIIKHHVDLARQHHGVIDAPVFRALAADSSHNNLWDGVEAQDAIGESI